MMGLRKWSGLLLLFMGLTASTSVDAQNIKGQIADQKTGDPVPYATLYALDTGFGTTTDEKGKFSIPLSKGPVVVSHLQYQRDTIPFPSNIQEKWIITMTSGIELEGVEIVDQSGGTRINYLDARNVEVLSKKELSKAACCNLSEAFETNASVDVSSSDASTGLKEIYLLGLNGNNILFSQENVPDLLGIERPFGLMSIPGPWLGQIRVSKGLGSVINGSDGIAGQIDYQELRLEKGAGSINTYINALGRSEMNASFGLKDYECGNHKIQTHYSQRKGSIDRNNDSFYDTPETQAYGANYTFLKETEKLHTEFFVRGFDQKLEGGRLPDSQSQTTTPEQTSWRYNRAKVGGKVGLKNLGPAQSLAFLFYGKTGRSTGQIFQKIGDFQENRFYFSSIYQTILGNTDYVLRSGFAITHIQQDFQFRNQGEMEPLSALKKGDSFNSPSVFTELNAQFNEQWSGVFGLRLESFGDLGTRLIPRMNLRYLPNETWVFKWVAGKSARMYNGLTENIRYYATSQDLGPELRAGSNRLEEGTNIGMNTAKTIRHSSGKETVISMDWYRTFFQRFYALGMNDLETLEMNVVDHGSWSWDSQKSVVNFLVQVKNQITDQWSTRLGYRYVNSKRPTVNSNLNQEWLLPKHRGFFNTAYELPLGKEGVLSVDLTLQYVAEQDLPSVWFEATQSPAYTLVNSQINYKRGALEWYLGCENLGNYQIPNPIVFSGEGETQLTNASLAWGPVVGRNVYLGLTWNFDAIP